MTSAGSIYQMLFDKLVPREFFAWLMDQMPYKTSILKLPTKPTPL